uniref:RDD family protein n=1 Tax=Limnohabitans sp. TaxID=1907725 RepID=UPI00404791EA
MIHKHLLAGISPRIAAAAADLVIKVLIFLTLIFISAWLKGFFNPIMTIDPLSGHGWIYAGISFVYTTTLMAGRYQATFGQRLFGLKVQMADGHSIYFNAALIRWFASIISAGSVMAGYLVALLVDDRRTFHDYKSGTVVVVESYLANSSRLAKKLADPRGWTGGGELAKKESKLGSHTEHGHAQSVPHLSAGNTENKIPVEKSEGRKLEAPFIADLFWEQALQEYEGEGRQKGVWARYFSNFGGDTEKAMAAYLQNRAQHFSFIHEQQTGVSRITSSRPKKPKKPATVATVRHNDKYEKLVEKFNNGSRSTAVIEAKLEAITRKRVTSSAVGGSIRFSFSYREKRYSLTKGEAMAFIGKRQKSS